MKISSLKDVDNVGAYLTAYLADIDLEDGIPDDIIDDDGSGNPCVRGLHGKLHVKTVRDKRYLKGGRLGMYPPNFKLYRMSKGIKPPTIERITNEQAMEQVGTATLTFERTVELSDPECGFSIVVNKRYYNRNRKKNKEEERPHDPANSDGGIPD